MILRHRAAAVPACDHAETQVQQPRGFLTGVLGAVAQPQQRTLGGHDAGGEFVQLRGGRRARRRQRQHEIVQDRRAVDLLTLQIDRHLDADRPHRRGQSIDGGAGQHTDCALRGPYPVGGFADRAHHAELIHGIMDGAHFAVGVAARGVPGDVQNRGAGELCLDQAADRVGRSRTGGREDDTEPTVHAGIAVRHMRTAQFASRHHEADGVAPADRVQHRNVVNGCDAKGRGHAARGQELGNQVADGVVRSHVVVSPPNRRQAETAREPRQCSPLGSPLGSLPGFGPELAPFCPGERCKSCRLPTAPDHSTL